MLEKIQTLLLQYVIGPGQVSLHLTRMIKFWNYAGFGITSFHFVKHNVVYNLRKNDHQVTNHCRGIYIKGLSILGIVGSLDLQLWAIYLRQTPVFM